MISPGNILNVMADAATKEIMSVLKTRLQAAANEEIEAVVREVAKRIEVYFSRNPQSASIMGDIRINGEIQK